MKKSYEIDASLDIGKDVFLKKDVEARGGKSGNLMKREIKGHIVLELDDEEEIYIVFDTVGSASFTPYKPEELMSPANAKDHIERVNREFVNKTFGG